MQEKVRKIHLFLWSVFFQHNFNCLDSRWIKLNVCKRRRKYWRMKEIMIFYTFVDTRIINYFQSYFYRFLECKIHMFLMKVNLPNLEQIRKIVHENTWYWMYIYRISTKDIRGVILFHCPWFNALTTDTQWRHKSKKSENLGRCGRQNMLRPYLKIWDWE